VLAEGFSVLSRPVGPHKTACQYRTTRDVTLQPIHLADARLHTEPMGARRFVCVLNAAAKWTGRKVALIKSPFS
jgi:type VI protein secretion system component VasA